MKVGQPQYFDNQNCYQLASIQSATPGLSVIIIGQHLATQYGPGTAICSVALGNLILWLIGIGIISMVDRVQSNAIDNIKSYIGKYGGMLAALILIISFLNWYAFQINFSMLELNSLLQFTTKWHTDLIIRLGAALGLLTALLSIGGIRLLKWLTTFSLPLLLCYHIYSISNSDHSILINWSWGLSFSAVLSTILMLLPGVINFPTFFRHSRSKAHSFLALTLLTIFITFFEISTIWMKIFIPSGKELILPLTVITFFVVLMLTLCNFLNIYLASACWKTFVPQFGGGKEYAIIGLMGTLTYTFIQISTPVQFLQDLTNSYLASLGVVLLMACIIRIIVKHRPRPLEKSISLITWLFGCAIATIYEIEHFLQGIQALLAGVNASILFFLCVVFVEETVWAIRKKTVKFSENKQ